MAPGEAEGDDLMAKKFKIPERRASQPHRRTSIGRSANTRVTNKNKRRQSKVSNRGQG